jgi:hypothetical protein
MTLKGIQPTIDRLMRKHKEDCEEISCNAQVAKQKLQVQCEEELMTRISEFQQSEQQARSGIAGRNDFANALLAEQNEHAVRMKKVKESLAEEEANSKKLHEMELQTLSKQHDAEIAKSASSKNIQHLKQNLQSKLEQRRYELQSELEQIDRDCIASKKEWEEAYRKTSNDRLEKRKEQMTKELILLRETKINDLIRASVVEQAKLESEMINTDESHMKAEHAKELESLRTKLHSAQIKNREVKSKLVSMGKSREALQSSLRQLEEDFDSISIKFDDAVAKKERKERQHQEILAELSRQTDQSLETIRCRQEECKLEIDRTKEAIASESRYLIPRMYCHNLVHLIQRMSSLS